MFLAPVWRAAAYVQLYKLAGQPWSQPTCDQHKVLLPATARTHNPTFCASEGQLSASYWGHDVTGKEKIFARSQVLLHDKIKYNWPSSGDPELLACSVRRNNRHRDLALLQSRWASVHTPVVVLLPLVCARSWVFSWLGHNAT